jgi:hypothetical protein
MKIFLNKEVIDQFYSLIEKNEEMFKGSDENSETQD